MHTQSLSVSLISNLFAAITSASPLVLGLDPEIHWYASSHFGGSCGGAAFQRFTGNGASCQVIEEPPAENVAQIGSVLVGSNVATYDFSFLPDTTCPAIGAANKIQTVDGGEVTCIDVSTSKARTFNVNPVHSSLKRSSEPIKPRNPGPESTWTANFYTDSSCGGEETKESWGSASSGCLPVYDPAQTSQKASGSVLISASFGTYDFSFFTNQNCAADAAASPKHEVSSGESLCVPYSDPLSYEVVRADTIAKSKRASIEAEDEHNFGHGPVTIWNLTTYPDQNCSQTSIQNFQGSGSHECTFISGGNDAVNAGSAWIEGIFGTYDFTFYRNSACETTTDNLTEIFEVEGNARCVQFRDLDPESFRIDFLAGILDSTTPTTTTTASSGTSKQQPRKRQGGPIVFWAASAYTTSDCSGTAVTTYAAPAPACEEISDDEVKSVFVSSTQGSYDFTFFESNDGTCRAEGTVEPVYEVAGGEKGTCVPLATAAGKRSFYVKAD